MIKTDRNKIILSQSLHPMGAFPIGNKSHFISILYAIILINRRFQARRYRVLFESNALFRIIQ